MGVDTVQSRLESVMLEGSVAWWEIDLETGRTEFHENKADMLGFDPDRFDHYEEFLELVHPEDRDDVVGAMEAHLAGERDRYDVEYRIRTADGDYRWFHDVGSVTRRGPDGDPRRVAGLVLDITERKERERKLDLLRERSRALMYTETREETAQVAAETADEVIGAPLSGVHLLNGAGDTLLPAAIVDTVNEAFDEPPTYPRDAPPGSRAALVWEVFDDGDPLVVEDVGDLELTEETPAGCVLLHPIGEHGMLIVSSPEPGAFTETDRTLAEILATNLTTALDRVEREQRLRRRQRRLERLHEATRELIEAESSTEVAERVERAAEDILGFPIVLVRLFDPDRGGLVPVAQSDSVDELIPDRPVFTPGDGSLNWEAYESGEAVVHDDIDDVERAVDSDTPIRSLFVIPLGEHGTLSAGDTHPGAFDETDLFLARILATAAETAFDATEREAELRRRRDELRRQNEQLDEFASIVSHDLRGPLNVVAGSLELAEETGDPDHFERARRGAERMKSLIDDLLSLARAGESPSELERVRLVSLVTRCQESVATGPMTVTVEGDPVVWADRSRLAQLLENLLRNAVEHAGDGTPPTVTVGRLSGADDGSGDGTEPESDGFYVADDGPGIPPEERESVFESGYSTTPDGTGFGLSIVREIAEAHGWTVTLTEGGAGGARFEFTGVEMVE